jgi:hydrogenase maturation protease
MPCQTPTVIIGLGNTLMRDEGIGVAVAARLQRCTDLPAQLEVVDLGSGGMGVLHEIRGRRKAVIVDCAYMNSPPATMRRFTLDEVRSAKVQTRLSLHEGDLLQTLELARHLGDLPPDVMIYGIEPESVAFGEGLSDALARRLDDYAASIRQEISGSN